MTTLDVEVGGHRRKLTPEMQLTFGRDQSCDVCLDPKDIGISRIAGRIWNDGSRWIISNLSRKRALHIVDSTGFALPLPIHMPQTSIGQRVVDQTTLTVLIAGDLWTHALILTCPQPSAPPPPAAPLDPQSTRTQMPRLTDRRREVLIALARGYLRPYPHYDPRPRTYQEIADLLGLTRSQVVKRIEAVRADLVQAGVMGLDGELDARRPLCEWLLAMRLITPADNDWLQQRLQQHIAAPTGNPPHETDTTTGSGGSPPAAAAARPATGLPTTTHPLHDELTRIAEQMARHIAPALMARLRTFYGDAWQNRVNANRRKARRLPGQDLRDYRFCLSILADDPATRGWAADTVRDSARELYRLANHAAHRRTLKATDIQKAHELAGKIRL